MIRPRQKMQQAFDSLDRRRVAQATSVNIPAAKLPRLCTVLQGVTKTRVKGYVRYVHILLKSATQLVVHQ